METITITKATARKIYDDLRVVLTKYEDGECDRRAEQTREIMSQLSDLLDGYPNC